ncbi:LigA (fragment) [Magnetospirillum sp. UT-4]
MSLKRGIPCMAACNAPSRIDDSHPHRRRRLPGQGRGAEGGGPAPGAGADRVQHLAPHRPLPGRADGGGAGGGRRRRRHRRARRSRRRGGHRRHPPGGALPGQGGAAHRSARPALRRGQYRHAGGHARPDEGPARDRRDHRRPLGISPRGPLALPRRAGAAGPGGQALVTIGVKALR